jgi:hypothetical protein
MPAAIGLCRHSDAVVEHFEAQLPPGDVEDDIGTTSV